MPRRRRFIGLLVLISAVVPAALAADSAIPDSLKLVKGELHSLTVNTPTRVAIGDPKVVDVTVVSDSEVLLHAMKVGTTNLMVWDQGGQHSTQLTVIDTTSDEIAGQLSRMLGQLNLLESVHVDQQGSKFFLTGQVPSKEDVDRLNQLVGSYPDVTNLVSIAPTPPAPLAPLPQMVRLGVQVIELNRDYTEKLGVKWNQSIGFSEQPFGARSGAGSTTESLLASSGEAGIRRLTQPFRIGTLFRTGFSQTIDFLISKGQARILAEPSLVTTSGKEATSFMGTQVPVISATSVGVNTGGVSATIEFKEVGVKLTMTPTVLEAHDKIDTILKAEVSSIDSSTAIQIATGTSTVAVPGFKTRKTSTEVTTKSGETIVIAGLLQSEDSKSVSQVPGLGDMPVVGRLFRSPEVKSKNTELVIAVTPELKLDEGMQADRKFALEQALAVAEVTASVEDPRLRYALQVQDRIAKALRYPKREGELKLDGRVKLKLHLFADGTLARVMVAQSSGIDALDMEALKAAESQSPYPAFPAQMLERELWIEVPVIFRPS